MTIASGRISSSTLEPNTELWQQLKSFQFGQDVVQRLVKETQYPLDYAQAVLEEYRKLIYLLASSGDSCLAGSVEIEESWRVHLLYSQSYVTKLCGGVIGRLIHHDCDDGSESPDTMSERFSRTLSLYRSTFGEPPQAIWSKPHWLGYWWGQRLVDYSCLARSTEYFKSIPAQHQPLWQDIQHLQFDKSGALYPFSLRLAEESFNCDYEYALQAIEEYRKFLFLAAVSGHQVVPSLDVDEVWHLHLCSSKHYWQKMRKAVGRDVHHQPSSGSQEDRSRLTDNYQHTLSDYERYFGAPPERIWGGCPIPDKQSETSLDITSV
jgi:hypothetical protein